MNASTTNMSQNRSRTPGTERKSSDASMAASTSSGYTLSPSEGAKLNPASSSDNAFLISLNSKRRLSGWVKSLQAHTILPARYPSRVSCAGMPSDA